MIEKNEDWCNFENPNFSIDIFVAVCAWRALFRDRSIDNDLDEEKIKDMFSGWCKLHNVKIKKKKLEELSIIITPDRFKGSRFINDKFESTTYCKEDDDSSFKRES